MICNFSLLLVQLCSSLYIINSLCQLYQRNGYTKIERDLYDFVCTLKKKISKISKTYDIMNF